MKEYSEAEKAKLLNDYLNRHGDNYNENQITALKSEFGKSYKSHLTQIYSALNLMNADEDPYLAFTTLIEKIYGLDINILEIGGGIYPALGFSIRNRQQQIGKGKITVYDPLISKFVDSSNIKLIRDDFTRRVDISQYDLIVGKEPCAATEMIITKASEKELVLSPCKCYDLLPDYISFDADPLKQWYNYVYASIKRTEGTTETAYLDSKMHYDNPIYIKTLKRR